MIVLYNSERPVRSYIFIKGELGHASSPLPLKKFVVYYVI